MGSSLFAYVSLLKQLARINAKSIEWEVRFSHRKYVCKEWTLFPHPPICMLKSNLYHDGNKRWGLWEVIGSWGNSWALMNGICGLRRQWKDQRAIFLPCEGTGRREQSVPGKGPSPDPDHTGTWPQTSTLQNCEKYIVVLKPPVCGILL